MKAVVDRHGREYQNGALSLRPNGKLDFIDNGVDLSGLRNSFATEEIVALAWTGPVPDTFDPPRDSQGRPVCVGDVLGFGSGVRLTVDRIDGQNAVSGSGLSGLAFRINRGTLLRFANTTEDIGAVDMSRAAATEGEWRVEQVQLGERERYRYGSDHRAPWIALNVNGIWAWASAEVDGMRSAGGATNRAEAERLALGKPLMLVDVVSGKASWPSGAAVDPYRQTVTPALIPATEQARRVASPWTATGRDLDALLDAEGTSRLPGDDDEAARAQLLRSMWTRGPMQVVGVLEAGILEARRAQQYGKRVEAKGTQVRKFASVGLARVVAWAVSGERLAGAEGGGR